MKRCGHEIQTLFREFWNSNRDAVRAAAVVGRGAGGGARRGGAAGGLWVGGVPQDQALVRGRDMINTSN